jgi:hypothetical protein
VAATLAAIRPDDWNFPLLLHVLGAMVLVGALVLAVAALFFAWRDGSEASARLAFRSLLIGVIPAWIVMRVSAQIVLDKEGLEDAELAWIEIGFIVTEPGFLFIIIATVLAGLAARRARRGESAGAGVKVAAVLGSLLIAAYVVATWAMTTKPV